MIVAMQGVVELKEPTFLHLNLNGITYYIHISLSTFNQINSSNIKLLIRQIIKEESNMLFGFLDIEEKQLFDNLIKVNGVGSKVALSVCSTFSPSEFLAILKDKNSSILKKVPGIGEKVANRIILEIKEFNILSEINISLISSKEKAKLSLESLGFKRNQIDKVLKDLKEEDISILIKKGLKLLNKI